MSYSREELDRDIRNANRAMIGAIIFLLWCIAIGALASCGPRPANIPPPAPEAVAVYVPIVKPCEVAKVAKSALPSDGVAVPNDIFEAVKLALGDRAVALSDREKLSAANDDPCPPIKP